MSLTNDEEFVLAEVELPDGEFVDFNYLMDIEENLNDSLLNEFVNEGE